MHWDSSKRQSKRKLKGPGITDCRNLPEIRRWARGERPSAENTIKTDCIHMISQVKPFCYRLDSQTVADVKSACDTAAQVEEVGASSHVPPDIDSPQRGTRSRTLDG